MLVKLLTCECCEQVIVICTRTKILYAFCAVGTIMVYQPTSSLLYDHSEICCLGLGMDFGCHVLTCVINDECLLWTRMA